MPDRSRTTSSKPNRGNDSGKITKNPYTTKQSTFDTDKKKQALLEYMKNASNDTSNHEATYTPVENPTDDLEMQDAEMESNDDNTTSKGFTSEDKSGLSIEELQRYNEQCNTQFRNSMDSMNSAAREQSPELEDRTDCRDFASESRRNPRYLPGPASIGGTSNDFNNRRTRLGLISTWENQVGVENISPDGLSGCDDTHADGERDDDAMILD